MKRLNLFIITLLMAMVAMAAGEKEYDFVVAKDGSGDFTTVQEAINAVPDFRKEDTRIFIKNGTYKEKIVLAESKARIVMIGESVENTIICYDDYAGKKNIFGENKGTSGSSGFYIYGPDFRAKNITFQNTAGPVGQAVAVFVSGQRAIFDNCRFLGHQDTLYTYGKVSQQLYRNCYIEGTVDFIFGSSTAYFEHCIIHCLRTGGYLTAASTPEHITYGYVFNKCKLTAANGVEKVMLGRPWRPYAQTVFVDCTMGKHISPLGWHNWGVEKEKTARYSEVGSIDPQGNAIDVSQRVKWSKQAKREDYTIDKVLADPSKPDWYKAEF